MAPNGWSLGVLLNILTLPRAALRHQERKIQHKKINSAEAVKPYSGPTDSRV